MVDQHHLDSLRRVADLQDRIAQPVDAGDFLAIDRTSSKSVRDSPCTTLPSMV